MKIFVAGKTGQLAMSIAELGQESAETIACFGRPDFDLSNAESIKAAIKEFAPDIVINAAAYTAVDLAESEEEIVSLINGQGAGCLAEAAAFLDIPILHLSTDYVFDGEKDAPYDEDDPVSPLGAYGRSKLAGEEAVKKANPKHLILRTAWVYSPFGKNFVKTMLRLAKDRDEVGVVKDQIGAPSYAIDLADGLLKLCRIVVETNENWGTYHFTAPDFASWADVAAEVFQQSAEQGGPEASVRRITTAEYPTQAKRPASSRLSTTKLKETFGIELPEWRSGVARCTRRLVSEMITV